MSGKAGKHSEVTPLGILNIMRTIPNLHETSRTNHRNVPTRSQDKTSVPVSPGGSKHRETVVFEPLLKQEAGVFDMAIIMDKRTFHTKLSAFVFICVDASLRS